MKKKKANYGLWPGVVITLLLFGSVWFFGIYYPQDKFNTHPGFKWSQNYNFICDGKDIRDVCKESVLKYSGKVLINDCKSGKSYVCETIEEIPIE